MENAKKQVGSAARTRSIAFVGLTIAIMAVSAWVTVPLGPVPFTLQIFALTFALLALSPKECAAAIAGYLALGAVGVPVFSGMRGGIGVLAGPTGGFLWGYVLGGALALVLLHVLRSRFGGEKPLLSNVGTHVPEADGQPGAARTCTAQTRMFAVEFAAALVFLTVAYVCGWAQFMAVAHVGPAAAFVTAIAPYIVVDIIKIVAAVFVARAVRAAVR